MSPGLVGHIQGWSCVVLGPPTKGVGAMAGLHQFAQLILLLCLPLPLAVPPSFILLLPHQLQVDDWKGISRVRGQRECGLSADMGPEEFSTYRHLAPWKPWTSTKGLAKQKE